MERLIDYDRAIIVDAIHTGRGAAGMVSRLLLEDLPDPVAGYTNSSHDTSLRTALEVGRTLGARLPPPEHVTIVVVETTREYDFSEELSPSVRAAVPRAAALVLGTLDRTDPSLEEAHHGVH
jgi:hydrogenase maturation protease